MKLKLPLRLAAIVIVWLAAAPGSFPAQQSRAEHCRLISAQNLQPKYPKLVFDYINLDSSSDVSDNAWQSVVTSIRQTDLQADPGWADELQQAGVVYRLMDQGYVRATATVEVSNIESDPTQVHVGLTIHIEAGPQYTVSSIAFRSSDPNIALFLGDAQLRDLVPLQSGDTFSSSKLRLAFDQLRKAYDAEGYIDFVPSPEMKFDNANHQIALVLDLQQGKQYRIGTITIRDLSPSLENELRSLLLTGNAFDPQLIDDFYESRESELPADAAPEGIEISKDIREGIVDLVFDLGSCAQVPPDTVPPPHMAGAVLRKKVDPVPN